VEDYLEVIYELIESKGYARTVEIGQLLHVATPSVTKMVQRMHDQGLVLYERYRGVVLTPRGASVARGVRRRHGVVSALLQRLGVDEAAAHRATEGIEHHLDAATLRRIAEFVEFIEAHPDWWGHYHSRRRA
jgi:Mn-dependent DtxR family transcriptional regulator